MTTTTIAKRPILRLPSLAAQKPAPTPTAPARTSAPVPARKLQPLSDERVDARVATLARLRELSPAVFNIDEPVALKIGIREDIIALLGLSEEAVADALRWWTCRAAYVHAINVGGPRYALDGAVAGQVGALTKTDISH